MSSVFRARRSSAACTVSPVAATRATLAMAGARVLADALAERAGGMEGACARHEARLRPWVE